MDKIQHRLQHLLGLYLTDQASSEELEEFWDFADDPVHTQLLERLIEQAYQKEDSQLSASPLQRETILNHIFGSEEKLVPIKKTRLWPRIVAAASVVLVLGAGIFYYATRTDNPAQTLAYQNDIAPGKNGATLTLADGRKISINEALAGNIAAEAGVKISKTKDGQIIYEVTGNADGALAYNTLSTTRGEQTQVRLPDGSLVFLNAASSLRYPTRFTGQAEREVELSGEGYFEVAKDKAHPFIVKSDGQQVEVLGTHFNVVSYPGSGQIRTTLVEGAVRVMPEHGKAQILKPNQQMVLTSAGAVVKDVEAEYEVAWKEGFFMFNNESLESIMDKVALWYDVQVVYGDVSLKKETFIGTVNRFDSISQVLEVLEQTKVLDFKVQGRKITINRK